MWKKDEAQPAQRVTRTERPSTPVKSAPTTQRATIGRSITIKGDVTGNEDLLIQGRVDGSVTLEQHAVAVGGEGRVNANITGRVITIEGEVDGDLTAQEQIVLLGSARVQGDIKAPRVVLEDGATFRGLVDMGSTAPRSSDGGVLPDAEASTGNGSSAVTETDRRTGTKGKTEAARDAGTGSSIGTGSAAGVGSAAVTGSGSATAKDGGTVPGTEPAGGGRAESRKGKATAGPTGRVGG